MRTLPVAPLLAALACLTSCMSISPRGISVASEPPGARVHVDGRDSGWVTPCQIALDAEETHVVKIAMDGFQPRELVLSPLERHGIVAWHEGVNGVKSTIRFPLLLPTFDLLFPFRHSQALAPGHVFVRLRPAEAP
jgi:hypothetical protein